MKAIERLAETGKATLYEVILVTPSASYRIPLWVNRRGQKGIFQAIRENWNAVFAQLPGGLDADLSWDTKRQAYTCGAYMVCNGRTLRDALASGALPILPSN